MTSAGGGRRRPPAARHDGHEKADTILWRTFRPSAARHEGRGNADVIPRWRLQSGPVITANKAKRCLGEAQFNFDYYLGVSQNGTHTQKKSPYYVVAQVNKRAVLPMP
ncbi:hypothetical protein THAOC_14962 [Thalassiosira oceanica]|uniref:Uncharacterized protein n=1 Tax=Thalassiosira oceanica TaxID=159749 RepID=K0STH7_THAOC|nr:hypothetical protein THAOC_14962 [Thalassiosira oceanica]|eukprot:EJK64316.1 hypothetical protein THAOC_14962 [Thalassiosira oceanica]